MIFHVIFPLKKIISKHKGSIFRLVKVHADDSALLSKSNVTRERLLMFRGRGGGGVNSMGACAMQGKIQ